ncbi:lantibiotic dehydratase C-terminal domain-containing protein [Nonomuraea sp. NPDC050536]|uniref:lantibiotic dehydratase C-terminal domain-containing protein n=1 Tax=Nonomuraea sp. NPDC050536 TaxID=3364366 RepID=UPI0037C70512
MSWVSAHVFSQGSLDDMIVELAGPLLGETGFFLRYWEGGPHLRIRVRDTAAEVVVKQAESWLRDHPSEAVIDPEEYARLAETLAAREGVPDYARGMFPNDSVQLIPYRPEHDRYGTGASLEAVEGHFHESSRIALELLAARLPHGRRDTAWLTMLLAAWEVTGPEPGPVAPADERLASLAVHARKVVAQGTSGGVVGGWHASVRKLAGELERAGFEQERVARTVDLCAHLLANRLGIRVHEEARLRAMGRRAVRA